MLEVFIQTAITFAIYFVARHSVKQSASRAKHAQELRRRALVDLEAARAACAEERERSELRRTLLREAYTELEETLALAERQALLIEEYKLIAKEAVQVAKIELGLENESSDEWASLVNG